MCDQPPNEWLTVCRCALLATAIALVMFGTIIGVGIVFDVLTKF